MSKILHSAAYARETHKLVHKLTLRWLAKLFETDLNTSEKHHPSPLTLHFVE